ESACAHGESAGLHVRAGCLQVRAGRVPVRASVASRLKSWVELLEVNAGVLRGELPVDVCVGGVSRNLPGPHFPTKGGWIHNPAAEALNGQDAELDLGYVQPASVLGRVVNLELLRNPARLFRRKG